MTAKRWTPGSTSARNRQAVLDSVLARFQRIKAKVLSWLPSNRRIQEKRRLEAVMREHGIPRKVATQITNHYFKRP